VPRHCIICIPLPAPAFLECFCLFCWVGAVPSANHFLISTIRASAWEAFTDAWKAIYLFLHPLISVLFILFLFVASRNSTCSRRFPGRVEQTPPTRWVQTCRQVPAFQVSLTHTHLQVRLGFVSRLGAGSQAGVPGSGHLPSPSR